MIDEGLFERYPCDAVFAMHNMPGIAQGRLELRSGAAMASGDRCTITLRGLGGQGRRDRGGELIVRLVVLLLASASLCAAGVALAAGSPAAGKKVFTAKGCGACHTFKAARSTGKIGPALTKTRLAADAKRAKQPYATFIRTSIVKPKAFVARGYSPIMPTAKLTKKQLDDLVAFVAKG